MVQRSVALLPEQRRFLERDLPDPDHWNTSRLYRVPPEITEHDLLVAAQRLIERHESLRLKLRADSRVSGVADVHDDQPEDVVTAVSLDKRFDELNLHEVCAPYQATLSLTNSRLLRFVRIEDLAKEVRVLVIVHHFVCDGVSFDILIKELQTICGSRLKNNSIELRPTSVEPSRYAMWLMSDEVQQVAEAELEYWMAAVRTSGFVPVQYEGANLMASTATWETMFSEVASQRIVNGCGLRGVSPVDCLAVGLAIAISGPEGNLKLNTVGHGRFGYPGQPNILRSIGWFSTRYPSIVTSEFPAGLESRLLDAAKARMAVPTSGIGYGALAYMSEKYRSLTANHPEVTLIYGGAAREPASGSRLFSQIDVSTGPEETATGKRENIHGVDVDVNRQGLVCVNWFYSKNQFSSGDIASFAAVVGRQFELRY